MTRPVVVLGAGAIGCLLAARLSRSLPVQLVARPATAAAIRGRGGVRIEGLGAGLYPLHVATRADPPSGAVVLVTVKAYDLRATLAELAPRLGPAHLVVVLQNGLGIRTLAEQVLGRPVVRAVTSMAVTALEPGRVAHHAPGKTWFRAGGEVLRAWRASGLPAVRVPDLLPYVWRKVAINAVVNPLSALLGVENGVLLPLRATARGLVEETVQVACASGQRMALAPTLATVRAAIRETAHNTSSMLQDVRAGRPTEIEWINGAVVRLGWRLGIAVPRNEQLLELVRCLERRSRQEAGRRPSG